MPVLYSTMAFTSHRNVLLVARQTNCRNCWRASEQIASLLADFSDWDWSGYVAVSSRILQKWFEWTTFVASSHIPSTTSLRLEMFRNLRQTIRSCWHVKFWSNQVKCWSNSMQWLEAKWPSCVIWRKKLWVSVSRALCDASLAVLVFLEF